MRTLSLLLLALPLISRTVLDRLQPAHLEAVHQQRVEWMKQRVAAPRVGVYQDFRAILHVHAEDAPHTLGTRQQVLKAAQAAGVSVIMFTDHRGPKPDTWRGFRDSVLFIPGSEDDHELRFPDPTGELRFLSHLEEQPDKPSAGFAGMEIYNRHTDAKEHKDLNDYIRRIITEPKEWKKLVERLKQYPDEVFAAGTDALPLFLDRWDREIAQHRFTGIAANDAHQNQVINGVTLDPYEVAFRHTSTHILARELTEPEIRNSLREGHVYVAHDWLCEPAGFTFVASNNLGIFDMGDAVPMSGNTRLEARLPIPARLKLIHKGKVVFEATDSKLTYPANAEGPYRLEAWLTIDGEDRPWIFSNPIYLQKPEPLALPPTEISANVELKKDIPYLNDDLPKHKLDLYLPKGKKNFPILVFLHGGSWRSGDRANYPALGNRFARTGIGVVIPSYRLMPANPHPAQIEDVAAAFAWVHKHIAGYGGDVNRIYVGGHSSGGHLAALLTEDTKYLARHDVPAAAIKGVAALSGIYDVRAIGVFGDDVEAKRDASPLFHVRKDSPPFVITYCQWDYFALPQQARDFAAALKKAFVPTEVVYIPRENHISEIINVWKDDDATVQAVLSLIHGQ